MSFPFCNAVGSSYNRTKFLSAVSPIYALTLLALCVFSGIVGCGLTNGRQHGLGAGINSGPSPTTPTTVPPGPSATAPASSAVDSNTNMVYVVSAGASQGGNNGTFYAISGASNSVVSTLPGLPSPAAVDVNSATNTIYIANAGNNTVSVVSGVSNAVSATIPVGNYPSALVVNPTTNTIYVDNFNDGTVSVIDGATNSVTATVSLTVNRINLIAVDPTLNRIYVGSNQQYAQRIAVIEGTSNSVSGYLNLKGVPQALASDPATHTLFVESNEPVLSGVASTSQIDLFDETTVETSAEPVGAIAVPGFVNSRGLAVNSSASLLYAGNNTSSAIDVLNLYTVTTAIPYSSSGSTVDSLSIDASTNTIYSVYSNSSNSNVGIQVIDGNTNATTANIQLQ